jgi:HK97 family phage major capsid protein
MDVAALYGSLDPAYVSNASWTMNSATRALFLGATDNYGRPLYVPSVNTDQLDMILGRTVVINQYQPNVAAGVTGSVLFGDLKEGYTLRTVGDLSIVRLNERYIDTGEVGFIGFARVGGYATDAGTHPIVALKIHA